MKLRKDLALIFIAFLTLLLIDSVLAQQPLDLRVTPPSKSPVSTASAGQTPALSISADFTLTLPATLEAPTDTPMRPTLKDKAGRAMLLQTALSPAWFQAGIAFHEGMHAVPCAVMGKCVVEKYRPFPGFMDTEKYGEFFYFGYVDTELVDGATKYTSAERLAISGGPLTGDIALFLIGDTLLSTVINPDSRAAPFVLTGTMIVPLIDFVKNSINAKPYSDLAAIDRNLETSKDTLILGGLALSAVGVWRVTHHLRRIYFVERKI